MLMVENYLHDLLRQVQAQVGRMVSVRTRHQSRSSSREREFRGYPAPSFRQEHMEGTIWETRKTEVAHITEGPSAERWGRKREGGEAGTQTESAPLEQA